MKTLTRHNIAAWAWISQIQYFVVQVIVAAAWPVAYSWPHHYISDLGNTVCGSFGGNYVCSPLHPLMNLSFVVLGISMALGAKLLMHQWQGWAARTGLWLVVLAGIGTVIVGFVPENTMNGLHSAGAILPFVLGNVALLVLGLGVKELPRWLRALAVSLGAVALIGLGLYETQNYLGIGRGNMERVVAYSQTVWMIACGLWLAQRK